jgi:uncharacterized protein (UPF0332 family)
VASRPDGKLADGFLRTARRLVPQGQKPDQGRLRRSVSSSYYAMFHALARMCADSLVGAQEAKRSNKAWVEVYRGLGHSDSLKMCQRAHEKNFPQPIKDFADAFKQLQAERHRADYDPTARFKKDDAVKYVNMAETAMAAIRDVTMLDKKAFAAWVLITGHGVTQARQQAQQAGKRG